ncbi:cytochrome b/b6 domain-containing protein [Bradyrhizobium sp. ISRA442]|uniref:cytochrome b/b6 domain-containing protein n=1 Tax=Bradyrhizobium sp. ISRA442 TaxID=2866197 RepID=UPI00311B183E
MADLKDTKETQLLYRQSVWTRVTHWVWAVTLFFMVTSGLQIFNAHPILYLGRQSGFGDKQYLGPQAGYGSKQFDNTVLDIHAEMHDGRIVGVTSILGHDFDTTGLLGKSGSKDQPVYQAFPEWATIPSYYDLATGRVIHFFFAWILVPTWFVWLFASLINGHFWHDIVPRLRDFRLLPRDIVSHLRLKFPHRRSYNVLQKLSYAVILILVIPGMIATGLTMSPGVDLAWPWLLDVFGGRQTARLLHFCGMLVIVLFFVVHIIMVIAAGPINEMRSMITGWYRSDQPEPTSGEA